MAFPDNWAKRISIPLNGEEDVSLDDYQTEILTVTWTSDMRSDFGDIRFTEDDGLTEIPYILKSYTSEDEAVFLLRPEEIPASPDSIDIYMYYGNPDATTTSSDPEDFYESYIIWEDAEDISPFAQKWGTVALETDSTIGHQCLKVEGVQDTNQGSGGHAISGITSGKWTIRVRSNSSGSCNFKYAFLNTANSGSDTGYFNGYGYAVMLDVQNSTIKLIRRDSDDVTLISASLSGLTDIHIIEVTLDQNGRFELFLDGVSQGDEVDTTYTSSFISEWVNEWSGSGSIKSYVDYIIRSQYTENPPIWGEWGTEENLIYNEDLKTLLEVPWYEGWLSGWEAGWKNICEYQSNELSIKTDGILEIEIPYVEGEMNEDFSDIRFTDISGITLLDYNLVDVSAEAPDYPATFHVRIPTMPASPGTFSICIYSGNPLAVDGSDPEAVYNVFDDFNDGNLNTTLWSDNHGVTETGGEAVLDYHSDNEMGYEDYILAPGKVHPNSRTIFRIHPQTLEGPFRFGLYIPSVRSRGTFQTDVDQYIGIVLANEYLNTHISGGSIFHDTIQQFDLVDHTFIIEWKVITPGVMHQADIYYDGDLIKSIETPFDEVTPASILFRDRGYVDYVISYNYMENPPTLLNCSGWVRPSSNLETLLNIPYHDNLKTLIEVYPVNSALKTTLITRQETDSTLKTLLRALPVNSNLKTLIEVSGLYSEYLKTLIEIPPQFLIESMADLDLKLEVNNEGHEYSDLPTLLTVLDSDRTIISSITVDWNVIRGGRSAEGTKNPKIMIEIDGAYYS